MRQRCRWLRVTVRRRRLRRDETLRRRRLRYPGCRRSWRVRVRWTVRTDRGSMAGAHSTSLDRSRIGLLLTVLILFPERGRRNRILALIGMHQVLTLHLLFILILRVRLSVGTGDAALAGTTLRICSTATRGGCHATVHNDGRGGVILHRVERRRARGAGAGRRLWLLKVSVARQMRSVTRLRCFRIIDHSHLRATDTGLPRYRAVQQCGLLRQVTTRILQKRRPAAVHGRTYLITVLLILLVELVDRTGGRLIEAVAPNVVRNAVLSLFFHHYFARLCLFPCHFVGPCGRLWNVMMQRRDTIEGVASDVLNRDEGGLMSVRG